MRAAYHKFHAPVMTKAKADEAAGETKADTAADAEMTPAEADAAAAPPAADAPPKAAVKAMKLSEYRKVGQAILAQPIRCVPPAYPCFRRLPHCGAATKRTSHWFARRRRMTAVRRAVPTGGGRAASHLVCAQWRASCPTRRRTGARWRVRRGGGCPPLPPGARGCDVHAAVAPICHRRLWRSGASTSFEPRAVGSRCVLDIRSPGSTRTGHQRSARFASAGRSVASPVTVRCS
jgi:hypothetical protein